MGLTCYICKHHEDEHGSPDDSEPYCIRMKCACGGIEVSEYDGMKKEIESLKQTIADLLEQLEWHEHRQDL